MLMAPFTLEQSFSLLRIIPSRTASVTIFERRNINYVAVHPTLVCKRTNSRSARNMHTSACRDREECVAPWVICVAAGLKDGQTLADFSSRGIPDDPLYHPTLTAPGVKVVAARATTGIVLNTFFAVDFLDIGSDAVYYTIASGTSMATPHVSGVAALILEANPGLTPDDVKAVLEATATPMPGYRADEVGAGYLNAYQAVLSVLAN